MPSDCGAEELGDTSERSNKKHADEKEGFHGRGNGGEFSDAMSGVPACTSTSQEKKKIPRGSLRLRDLT